MAGDRPNILLITTDQQHHRALGRLTPQLRTPHLDALAEQGMAVDRAYCTNPLCSPSRSSIITGRYPSSHGCWTIGVRLDSGEATISPSLPRQLSLAGYDTSLIGKAHFEPLASPPGIESFESQPRLRDLDFWQDFHGPYYGFDHIELARNHADESHVGQHYALWMEQNGFSQWRDHFQAWPPRPDEPRRRWRWDLPKEYHYSTWTGERAVAAIERSARAERPFFCWASFHDPHPPYLVPEPYASMYDPDDVDLDHVGPKLGEQLPHWVAMTQEPDPDFSAWQETPFANHGLHRQVVDAETLRRNLAIYFGMMTFVDDQVGRILARLDELGLSDNTLVVFTSDHGHYLGQHGLTAKGPFHYEDLLRVPFLLRWPGQVEPGSTSDSLLSLVDLAPTFLTAAGVDVPGVMQGMDQGPVWRGEVDRVRSHAIVENRHQPTAVDLRTYVDEWHKLTVYRGHPAWGEVFDLTCDPAELHNLFHDNERQLLVRDLALDWLRAEMDRESTAEPRVASA
jgi:arylsulfatase A-like enzyme